MNDEGVSAFSVYAKENKKYKSSNKESIFNIKLKKKFKNKKKLGRNNKVFSPINHKSQVNGESNYRPNKNNFKVDINTKEKSDSHIKPPFDLLSNKQLSDSEFNFISTNGIQEKKIKKKKNLNDENSIERKKSKNEEKVSEAEENVKSKEENTINKTQKNKKNSKLIYSDSVKAGEEVLSWMLSPMSLKEFFERSWEEKPLLIKHNKENYFKCICTMKDFDLALREKDMYFTKNLDVTSYIDEVRQTKNPEGKATAAVVWDLFNKGNSIRLLNPQSFIPNVRILNTTLQEFFQCFVGANLYLTPAGTQGFAPHYDDIEAFVLQLEGEKQWKLYNPRSPEEVLPRESSRNFKEDEIGKPIMEVTLRPGDMLYFPRGVIHQAKCLPHIHSLHLTVSCYQKNSWADLFEKVLPIALERAIAEDVQFRKGLPIGYLNHMGMIYSDDDTFPRKEITEKFQKLARKILEFFPLDAGADQMAADFIHDALPPCPNEVEKAHGADRNYNRVDRSFLSILKKCTDDKLGVKLIRAAAVRLVAEGDGVYLYYTTDNSLVYHELEATSVQVPEPWHEAVELLIRAYPQFTEMASLSVALKDSGKPGKWKRVADFVHFLWQRGLILFNKPVEDLS